MKIKLLPCPFCGGSTIEIAQDFETQQYFIACEDCATQGPCQDYEDQAERSWNERAIIK